jgi:hypothetical protein
MRSVNGAPMCFIAMSGLPSMIVPFSHSGTARTGVEVDEGGATAPARRQVLRVRAASCLDVVPHDVVLLLLRPLADALHGQSVDSVDLEPVRTATGLGSGQVSSQLAMASSSSRSSAMHRELVPGPPIEDAPIARLVQTTPLLEEERHVRTVTAVTDVADPSGVARPRAGSALPARDDPVDAGQIKIRECLEEGLDREEPHGGRSSAQQIDARQPELLILPRKHRARCWTRRVTSPHFVDSFRLQERQRGSISAAPPTRACGRPAS